MSTITRALLRALFFLMSDAQLKSSRAWLYGLRRRLPERAGSVASIVAADMAMDASWTEAKRRLNSRLWMRRHVLRGGRV